VANFAAEITNTIVVVFQEEFLSDTQDIC